MCEACNFSTSSPTLVSVCLSVLVGEKRYLIVALSCIPLMTSVKHLVICYSDICKSSLEKCLFISFAFLKLGCLFIIEFKSSSYIQDTSLLSDLWFANIFFHSVGCLFTFLVIFFWSRQVFNFDEVQFYFFFCYLYFWYLRILRTHQNTPGDLYIGSFVLIF